jgi:hypothetical protein
MARQHLNLLTRLQSCFRQPTAVANISLLDRQACSPQSPLMARATVHIGLPQPPEAVMPA